MDVFVILGGASTAPRNLVFILTLPTLYLFHLFLVFDLLFILLGLLGHRNYDLLGNEFPISLAYIDISPSKSTAVSSVVLVTFWTFRVLTFCNLTR